MTKVRGTFGLGAAAAVAVHAGLLGWLFAGTPPVLRDTRTRPPVRMRLVATAKPVPPPQVVESIPLPPPPQAPTPKRQVARLDKPAPKRIAEKAPPPPAPAPIPAPVQAPPPPVAAPPRKFTVAMDATIPGGGVAVPASANQTSWAFGGSRGTIDGAAVLAGNEPRAGAGDPAERGRKAAPIEAADATSLPRLLSKPSNEDLRASYPEAARRAGLEADVRFKILVGTSGEVVEVKVLQPVGDGFDQAAITLVKRFKFQAGQRAGRAAAIWIPWSYRFRLDG